VAKLKLCMLDPLFFPYVGGTEKVVLEVGSRLVSEHDCEVKVLTSMIPQADDHKTETIRGMKVIRTPSLYFGRLPGLLPPPFTLAPFTSGDLVRCCEGADIYHFHNRFWYSPLTYRTIERRLKSPMMLTVHNARPRGISKRIDYWGGVFDESMGNYVFGKCARINCVSQATLDDTIPIKHRRRATVIYNGVDTELFRPGQATDGLRQELGVGHSPVILSNGRLVEQKGFPVLLRALAEVRRTMKDVHLVIIGKGPLKDRLMAEAKALGVSEAVRIVTGIPEAKMPVYYGMADAFALASYYEPSSVALYEALGCGKAIVATSVGGNPEIVSGECGIIVPPRDPQATASALTRVLTDGNLRRGMERASRERAIRMFDWSVIAKEWIRSYSVLL
jgi:starch synthase